MKNLFKIKEIADVYGLSVDTLRIYEKIGILKPESVDEKTGYRYYTGVQMVKLKFILSLKTMGFTLHEIKKFFDGEINLEEKRKRLLLQQAQIKEFLLLYDSYSNPTQGYFPKIKTIREHYVLKSVCRFNHWSEILTEFAELNDMIIELKLTQSVSATPYGVFYDEEFKLKDISCSLYIEVDPSNARNVVKMPTQKYLTCIHSGDYEKMGNAYDFLYAYAKSEGLTVIGYPLERYLVSDLNRQLSQDFVTELCLPIKNKKTL